MLQNIHFAHSLLKRQFFFLQADDGIFFFQAEDGIRDRSPSRGLGDVYKRQHNNTPDFSMRPDNWP